MTAATLDIVKVAAVNLHLAADAYPIGHPDAKALHDIADKLEFDSIECVAARDVAQRLLRGTPAVAAVLPLVGATILGAEARGFPVNSTLLRDCDDMTDEAKRREMRAHGWMPPLHPDARYIVESYPTEVPAQRTH